MIANNIRKKGFTLIEILLIVFFIGLTSLGIYMMQGKTSDEVTISKEKEYILSLFDEIDRSASVLSRFQNISLQSLKDNGYISKTNGFELVSVNAPTPTRLEATYNNLKNKECSMFVSSIVNFSETYSAKINNIVIPSKADPKNITLECSNNLNEVVIVRENNMFGVALNTSPNGTNNPIIGQNINTCPVGVCNTMTPGTTVPFTPITVTINKPTVTIPGAVTTPTFTPGTPMVQPPVVPPVVTPPPPPPPVVTPPAGPTTPVTPPPPPPPPPVPSAQSKEITINCEDTICATITATYIPISATQGYVINSIDPTSFMSSSSGYKGIDYWDKNYYPVNYGYEKRDDGKWYGLGHKIVNGTNQTIITLESWNAYTQVRVWYRPRGN